MVFTVEVWPYGRGKMIWLKTDALQVGIANFGATISSVKVWSATEQRWIEVNCGFSSQPDEAEADTDYMGVTVGRCAGRVANAAFKLDGVVYHTDKNMGEHTCHGGFHAYHKKHWGYAIVETADVIGVRCNYTSPHMENGFPGELLNVVSYTIERQTPNTLQTDFHAEITPTSPAEATVVNMFNHAYWNLNGVPERNGSDDVWRQPVSVKNHWVQVPASKVAEADRNAIPTGEWKTVENTALDFRRGRVLKDGMNDAAVLDRDPCGYDHPLAIDGWRRGHLTLNAVAASPITNIKMEVYSTYPCMWVYSANNKKRPCSGRRGDRYERWSGIGLEPQYFPDAANKYPNYPPCVIRRGKNVFHETMKNCFTVVAPSQL